MECPLVALDPQGTVAYTPALPRVPHPRHDRSELTASETASTNGCPQGAAGPATLTLDPATRASVPKASERGSPHCESATTVGVGRPKVVRGRRRRKGVGASIHNLHGKEDHWEKLENAIGAWKGDDSIHLDDDRR
jgi:hypothetical protein